MSATDRPEGADATTVRETAARLRESGLCHLLVRADGDALAAATLLAGACDDAGIPYHMGVVRTREELRDRVDASEVEPFLVGASAPDSRSVTGSPVSRRAYEIATELGGTPDPVIALAGVVAAGFQPAEASPDLLDRADATPAPGVAIPTDDPIDGLAHSTLAHADFSGDRERVKRELDGMDDPGDVASLLALAAAGPDEATERAAGAIERSIRPYRIPGPFETLGGYADVLSAVARRSPGLGIALLLTGEGQEPALSAWRERALRVHPELRSIEPARYSGLAVARVDGPVEPIARLFRDFRSPEPVALALSEGEAAIASVEEPVGPALETAVESVGGTGLGHGRTGYARFDPGNEEALVDALREAV